MRAGRGPVDGARRTLESRRGFAGGAGAGCGAIASSGSAVASPSSESTYVGAGLKSTQT
jgi:hypothetical protein